MIVIQFANPAPLGLSAFAATTFLLSLFNLQSRGITTPNLIVGIALSYGGLVQLLAGMWEFAAGKCCQTIRSVGASNREAQKVLATATKSSQVILLAPLLSPHTAGFGSGILSSYTGHAAAQLDQALGLYLMTWFIFTFILLVASLRSSVALVALFFCLDVTFLLLGFYPTVTIFTKIGAIFGLVTSGIGWYSAAASLLTSETSYFSLPIIDLSLQRD
ncbi:uncharacterized protein MELLADRAFT_92280 [Melampsora larici-populina 98AG31]|uniref:Uncharacterized protein n=1 Tax=Melampsora larici-populina (strain 98AG31 / pathotype 3-4-7) TaxID=747676 RepID=F4R922_MELLP|nr:uncharacterized protein MELLADRAFT_92280 [Melampsora larici-populina 98AG31]EGG10911.1 hypothetical protein MELLADRAFT_92280 [Melampsora larici-populina 98AG31]